MNCPSMLYTGRKPDKRIDRDVFEDIKLNAFLTSEALDAADGVCGEADVLERRRLFKALDGERGLRSALRALYADITEVAELDALYREARSDSERDVIFVSLARSSARFIRGAAALAEFADKGGLFVSRAAEAFGGTLASPAFLKLTEELEAVEPLLGRFRSVYMKILGEKLKLTSGTEEGYIQLIAACADKLGLSPIADTAPADGRASRLSSAIVEGIARKNVGAFGAFADFRKNHVAFYDPALLAYSGEIAFYTGFCELFRRVGAAGIPLTFARLTGERRISARDVYDITLLTKDETRIVPNDALFTPEEPFCYLTGANGGGKTTYLRAIGMAVLMNMLGCPVACADAELFLPDGVFTHFPRDERFDKNGRFRDEQNRVDTMLSAATGRSVVLLNETYSATDEDTASRMTGALAETLWKTGALGIYITHQHGLSETEIPYLNVVVDRGDGNRRTYKVERQRGVLGSFARDILSRYALTREQLSERFGERA